MKDVNSLVVEDININNPSGDEVLIKIDVTAICGSDAHMLIGKDDEGTFPYVPGHEWSGHIIEIGKDVKNLKVGDRVTGEPFIPCRKCSVCRAGGMPSHCLSPRYFGFQPESPGGMSEYHLSPEERLFKIPDNVSDELGALIEPITVGYSAIHDRAGGVAPHDRVVIMGAGPIGLITTGIALITNAQVIVFEPQPKRIELAKAMGAQIVFDPTKVDPVKEVMDLTNGLGATRIFECSGNKDATSMTVDMLAEDGLIVIVALSAGVKHLIEINKLFWRNGRIIPSCGAPYFFPKTIEFLSKELVDFEKIITDRFPLGNALEGFMQCNKANSGKIVLYPDASNIPLKKS
jgi:2-desacetyl-2-hydroxyethyl bacteriochlorophyllide A dehydrogenase